MRRLTELQSELLSRFFSRRDDYFLTGGAALAGFHLGHRVTHDLDLFTTEERVDEGERTLAEIARELDLSLETIQRDPTFRRFLLQRRDPAEAVVVDLVRDLAPQLYAKMTIEGVRVDAPEEILANKLCALLSRVELRDLVDVMALSDAGFDPVDALPVAMAKDAGVSASQLAWVLSSFPIPRGTGLPGDHSSETLRRFREELIRRFAEAAYPPASS